MGEMSLPADYPTVPTGVYDEAKLIKLVRQIAMGIKDLPEILIENGLSIEEFTVIERLPMFGRMLKSEVDAWGSASNTLERVRVKSAAMLEELLPELYARANDRNEPLMAKMKLVEQVSKMAGFTEREGQSPINPGDKVQVIINLGADTRAEYVKTLPPKVIDNEPAPVADTTIEESLDAADQV